MKPQTNNLRDKLEDTLLTLVYGDNVPASEFRYLAKTKSKQYTQVMETIDEIIALVKAEKVAEMKKAYDEIYHIHMKHEWNEMSVATRDWLLKQQHDFLRLEATLKGGDNEN